MSEQQHLQSQSPLPPQEVHVYDAGRRFEVWERGLMTGLVIGAFFGPSLIMIVLALFICYDIGRPRVVEVIGKTMERMTGVDITRPSTVQVVQAEVPINPMSNMFQPGNAPQTPNTTTTATTQSLMLSQDPQYSRQQGITVTLPHPSSGAYSNSGSIGSAVGNAIVSSVLGSRRK